MFKKNKKQTENVKEKKVRTVKVGTHKKTVIASELISAFSAKLRCWCSYIFCFTAFRAM